MKEETKEAVETQEQLPLPVNRRQRRLANGINKKGARLFSNKKGVQVLITKLANRREFKMKRTVQRIAANTVVTKDNGIVHHPARNIVHYAS